MVPIVADTMGEDSETFSVTLSGPQGARLMVAMASGTITDDARPSCRPHRWSWHPCR